MNRLKRILWVSLTILSYLLLGGMGWLLLNSCTRKPKATTLSVIRIDDAESADSVKARLLRSAQLSQGRLLIIKKHATSAVTNYENAAYAYDTTVIDLP